MNTQIKTRADMRQLLMDLIAPLDPFYTRAGLEIGDTAAVYGHVTVRMEAFLRPLWGLVPYWAGGGSCPEWEQRYREGLAAGTDPDDPEYWGGFWNGDQRFVEMAAIAYGLLFAPRVLWEPLTQGQRENLARWLDGINHYELPICNWQFFRVLVNVALKKLGVPFNEQRLRESLEMIDSFYLDEGWYQDGDSGQRDYYTPFALHFYGLVYALFMGAEDPERCRRYRQRAMVFARQFIYWFDGDGTALPFGRSQTYRFAQAAFFSACALCDVLPFTPGQLKGIILRHLRRWLEKPILDRAGLLTIGYGYPNLGMAEKYNAPGSPYWAFKTFSVLALPESHPFWQAEEEALPPLAGQMPLYQANMLIRRYNSHTTAYTPGAYGFNNLGHFHEKYGKFAYDTKFGFSVAKSQDSLGENAPDSMLAFIVDGVVYVRHQCQSFEITKDSVISCWRPLPGVSVKTELIPTETGHIRIHQVESDRECEAFDCGFAVASDAAEARERVTSDYAKAANAFSRCTVSSKTGGVPVMIGADPNTSLIWSMTRIPAVRYAIKPGTQMLRTVVTACYEGKEVPDAL